MRRYAAVLALTIYLLVPTSVTAVECQFVLGFKTLRDLIGYDIVGECLENQHHGANGETLQQTTGGLLVWRKADNWTAFTDGYRTWINGPNGLVMRLNTERFAWEADYAPGGGITTPTPIPPLTPTPTPVPTQSPERLSPRATAVLNALPWIHERPVTAKYLRQLALISRPVFWAWMEQSGDSEMQEATVIILVELAKIDEEVALQIVQMPFMETKGDIGDYDMLFLLTNLARSDPANLQWVLSHPRLNGGIKDDQAAPVALLVLGLQDPEAVATIESLPWVRDGVARPSSSNFGYSNPDPTEVEQEAVLLLVEVASLSRQVFMELLSKSWIQDYITARERYVVSSVREFTYSDFTIAHRIIKMPFLETIEVQDLNILDMLRSLYRFDPSGVHWLLSDHRLAAGITDEQESIVALLSQEWQNPETATALRDLPWIRDGIAPSEVSPVLTLRVIALDASRLFQVLIRKDWVRDGLSSDEQSVIRSLLSISSNSPRRGEAVALRIIEMPFLESVDGADAAALISLQDLFWAHDPSYFHEVLSHPTLRDGITDYQAVRVSVLLLVNSYAPELRGTFLRPSEVFVERSSLLFPEFGKVDLAVISTSPVASDNMAWLKHSVSTQVEFMGTPFPRSYAALWVHDKGGGGGGSLGILHVGGLRSPATVAHEAAHTYWPFFPSWIAEGGAEFMERISENARIGSPIVPHNNGRCKHTDTLSGHDRLVHERLLEGKHSYLGTCPYSLGSGLLVDLYRNLGDEAFRQSFRSLYLKLRDEVHEDMCHGLELGVCYVKAAFVTDASPGAAAIAEPIINRWYYGSERGGR